MKTNVAIVDVNRLSARQLQKLKKLVESLGGDPDSIVECMREMTQYAVLSSKTDNILSILSIRPRGKSYCGEMYTNMIYNVVTSPYHRKKGYMTILMKHLIRELKTQKKRCAHLEVLKDNKNAIRFYKKLGFKIIDRCISPHFSYIMRLRLHSKGQCDDE